MGKSHIEGERQDGDGEKEGPVGALVPYERDKKKVRILETILKKNTERSIADANGGGGGDGLVELGEASSFLQRRRS